MIRRPPRSTLDRSSAASDVYKRQHLKLYLRDLDFSQAQAANVMSVVLLSSLAGRVATVSYTHLRAHETVLDLVCRLLLEKKTYDIHSTITQSVDTTQDTHD